MSTRSQPELKTQPTATATRTTRTKRARVNKPEALKLYLANNLGKEQIAQLQGVKKQSIHQALQQIIPPEHLIKTFKERLAEILNFTLLKQLTAFHSLTPSEQKNLVFRRGMVDFGIIYDKSRIEAGKATEIIDVLTIKGTLAELDQREQAIKGQLAKRGLDITDIEPIGADRVTNEQTEQI